MYASTPKVNMRTPRPSRGIAVSVLLIGLAVTGATSDDLAYWRLCGIAVQRTNGDTLRGYFRWHVFHEPYKAESLLATLRRIRQDPLELDTALVAVRYPDTTVTVATAEPVAVHLDSVSSIRAAPGPMDGRTGYNTPLVTRHQAELLQTKPNAMCSGMTEGNTEVWWLSYYPWIGIEELKPLCRDAVIGHLRSDSGSNLIRLEFYGD